MKIYQLIGILEKLPLNNDIFFEHKKKEFTVGFEYNWLNRTYLTLDPVSKQKTHTDIEPKGTI